MSFGTVHKSSQLQSTPPSSTPTTPTSSTPSSSTSCCSGSCTRRVLVLTVIYKQCVQVQRIWQKDAPNIVAADTNGLEGNWITTLDYHLHFLHVHIHLHINACRSETVAKNRAKKQMGDCKPVAPQREVTRGNSPPTVPCTVVPFFNSTVTVSLDNFIKNLRQCKSEARPCWPAYHQTCNQRQNLGYIPCCCNTVVLESHRTSFMAAWGRTIAIACN